MPEPCRPAIRITVGPLEAIASSLPVPPISAASSSLTIFTTCWPGSRLFSTSAPRQRSFSVLVKDLTTLKLTSASSRARRISRIAASTSDSLSLPRERTSERVDCRRSESWSNIGPSLASTVALGDAGRGYSASSASAYSAGSNGRRSSSVSPTPISFTGIPRSAAIASAMPPLAVPSSLVRTTPSTSTASEKTLAWRSPFWPVVASIEISVSCGALGDLLRRSPASPWPAPPSGWPGCGGGRRCRR